MGEGDIGAKSVLLTRMFRGVGRQAEAYSWGKMKFSSDQLIGRDRSMCLYLYIDAS